MPRDIPASQHPFCPRASPPSVDALLAYLFTPRWDDGTTVGVPDGRGCCQGNGFVMPGCIVDVVVVAVVVEIRCCLC